MKKYERSESQKEAMRKALETKARNAEARKRLRETEEIEEKKKLQEKLVAKAIAIKKKQIKKEKAIDEIDDEPEIGKLDKPQKHVKLIDVKPTRKYNFI